MTIVASNSLTLSNVNDGTITHYAYAYSADGTDRFTTAYPNLNLLDGTRDFSGTWGNASSWTNDGTYKGLTVKKRTAQWNGIYKTFTAPKDGVYTFSAYIKSSGNTANVFRYGGVNSTSSQGIIQKFIGNNFDWTRDSVTLNLKANDSVWIRYEISGAGTDSILWVAGYKLEQDSVATPYMPSSSEVTTADWPNYIGQYSDFTYTASTDPTKYAPWTIFKGNDGKDGIAGKDGTGIQTTTITYAGSTSGTTAPTSGWTSTIPTVAAGSYLWTKTIWAYTDNTSETGYSVAKMGNTGPTGDPGKVVSNTEPTTRFKGLTWKYLGTSDLTASDGTVILSGTEYYWSGTNWILSEINAHNINGNNLTITDGEFVSTTTNGQVSISTEIKDNHIIISKTDGTVNTRNDIALDSEQGLAQKFTNINTGFYRLAGINFQGPFISDSDGNYAQLTPRGTDLSTDVPWTNLTLASGFSIGSGGKARYRVKNGVLYIHFRKIVCPAITGNQPNTICYVPANGIASDGYDSFGVMSATNSTRIQYNDSGDGKVAIVPASNTTAGQGFNGFLICPMD